MWGQPPTPRAFSHNPSLPRKVLKPLSTDIPAPVKNTIFFIILVFIRSHLDEDGKRGNRQNKGHAEKGNRSFRFIKASKDQRRCPDSLDSLSLPNSSQFPETPPIFHKNSVFFRYKGCYN